MHVISMASWQEPGVTDAYTIGVTLALSNGISEGIAVIRQDLVSLGRTMAASPIGLEHLTRLAEGLRALGPQRVVPIAARTVASLPQVLPAAYSEPDVVSGDLSGPAYPQPVRDGSRPDVSAQAGVAPQPRSAARPGQAIPFPELPPMPGLTTTLTATAQEHLSAAPAMAATGVSVAQVSPNRPPDTAARPLAAAPDGRLLAISAQLTATPLNAIQNTAASPGTIAPTTPRATDVPGIRSILASETMITAAFSQASLVTGPLAPPTAPPTPQTAPQVESVAPLVVSQTVATRDRVAPTDVPRPPSGPRQSLETAPEPRQGVIILDGAQLGRWVVDRIARQASRPVAGTTGIDPRINPTFPGAPTSA
jgi:hypothetical protein